MNDIVSLKKEIVGDSNIVRDSTKLTRSQKKSSLHSLIPITMYETGLGLDPVVESLLSTLRMSADSFDQAANRLLLMTEQDPKGYAATKEYIDSFKTNMTGSYLWS